MGGSLLACSWFVSCQEFSNLNLQNSGIEKAFLFDVVSKIYIATDSSPVDMQSYELCCDMIDVVIDLSSIYGYVLVFYSNGWVFVERMKGKLKFIRSFECN